MTAPATLRTIVDNVPGILEVVRAPLGLDVAVGEFVIHDPTDRRCIESGDVVLAVGLPADEREAIALLGQAGVAGAAAVVFKLTSDAAPPRLVNASTDAGIALFAAPRDIVWGQLHALLRTARAAAGVAGQIGPGGAPVGDLFALANAVSSMLGGATTIEDPRSTVLAYSTTDAPTDEPRRQTILGRQVPDTWLGRLEGDGVFRRLWTEGCVRVDYSDVTPGFLPRIAVPILAGGEVLGSIWVAEGRTPFTEEAEAALREAGHIAALHLLRHQSSVDLERQRRGELLRSMLEGRTPPAVVAVSLGIGPSLAVTVLAFELSVGDDAHLADQVLVAGRALNLITVYCEAFHRRAISVAEGHIVYALLADRAPPGPERLTAFASGIVKELAEACNAEVRAGIGPTVAGLAGALDSKRDADQALRAGADARHPRPVAHIDDVRSRAILLELCDLAARKPALRVGKLGTLVEHDHKRKSSYLVTLRAYLDAFGDVPAAAASVNIHPNTFRYRLRRLLEHSGINLADPVERLITQLQLVLLDDATAGKPTSATNPPSG